MTSNEAPRQRQPRDKTARSDTARFRKKNSKEEMGPSPEGDIHRIATLVTAPSFGSQHFNPADRRRSTASNNQPEIRCKHGQANCREAQQKNEILVVRGSGCGCGYRSTRGGLRRFGPGLVRRGVVAGRADGVVSRPRLDSLPSRLERVIRPRVQGTGRPRALMLAIA